MQSWPDYLDQDRRHLWGLCYRLTGDAAESEDLVQETFARALARPPSDPDRPLRPWLTRVATNLAIDALRRRQHQAYAGPWLPAPVRDQAIEGLELAPSAAPDSEERYGVLESASIAFLVALEQLEPRQRAALVLCDVVGHTSQEAAEILDTSPANVRQLLSRARKTLRDAGAPPSRRLSADAVGRALEQFLQALFAGDLERVTKLLADDVEFSSDSAGEFRSATNVVRGAERVAALLVGILKHAPPPKWSSVANANGAPVLLATFDPGEDDRQAPRSLLRVDVQSENGENGKIGTIHLVLATRKLQAVEFSE